MSDPTRFTIGEVAAMVGMSAHTIRAWEKRYQILTPQRTESGQRRYTMADVDLLQQVKLAVSSRHLSLKLAVGFAQGRVEEPPEAPVDGSDPLLARDLSVEPPGLWRTVADLLPELLRHARRERPDVVCLSAAYLPSLRDIQLAVGALRAERLRVMVGGPAFVRVPLLWKRVGADAHAGDGRIATVVMRRLLTA